MPKRSAFTLIEVLVIIAIIAILLAILAPTMGRAGVLAEKTICASNMHQLALAWQQYASANRMYLVSSWTGDWCGCNDPPCDPKAPCWVKSGNSLAAISQGAMWLYTRNYDIYRCPTPVYNYYNSYALNGTLHGEGGMTARGYVKRFTQIRDTSTTMAYIEEDDYRGYNMNSWMIGGGEGQWIDYVAGNHDAGDNLSFCDGHVEYWVWEDPDTLTYPYPPSNPDGSKSHSQRDAGSVDVARIQKVFWPR